MQSSLDDYNQISGRAKNAKMAQKCTQVERWRKKTLIGICSLMGYMRRIQVLTMVVMIVTFYNVHCVPDPVPSALPPLTQFVLSGNKGIK